MHLEAITSKQKEIFKKLYNFPDFYLSGGTALALQLGHRVSIDFDLFTNKNIIQQSLNRAKKIFNNSKIEIIRQYPEQLSILVDKVKIDFVKYPFPLLFKLIKYQGVSISKYSEIAIMKAYAIGKRPVLKDYIDLYFLLNGNYITLDRIIKLGQKKYKEKFNPRLFLEQLFFFDDIEEVQIDFLKKSITRDEMQIYFKQEIKKIKLS